MSKLKFQASNWLHSSQSTKVNNHLSEQLYSLSRSLPSSHFTPKQYLIPDWCGESLISKNALSIKKKLEALKKDALLQFKDFHNQSISMKSSIYREFQSYMHSNSISLEDINCQASFWEHVTSKDSEHETTLKEFIDLYCFRVSTIYLYKIRFFLLLSRETKRAIGHNDLLNPSSFISKYFVTGSQSELNCDSLKSNTYSWFRPSSKLTSDLENLKRQLLLISTTELMKLCTYQDKNRLGDTSSNQNLNFEGHDFSHSLSHQAFGSFITLLLTKLPKWFSNDGHTKPGSVEFDISQFLQKNRPGSLPAYPILNTKFEGDALGPICHSHWVSTETNRKAKLPDHNETICPDFIDFSFTYGKYTQICHELKFLASLVEDAANKSIDPIGYISAIYKEKAISSNTDTAGQLSMLAASESNSSKTVYERIVLNLISLPKSNQHYHLLARINDQVESLHQNGYLYIFSNQNLFVPSQSDKVNNLLKKIKVMSSFNLEDLKGKGEIPNFLYIFKKRKTPKADHASVLNSIARNEREECMRFTLSGKLTRFGKFELFNEELSNFFNLKTVSSTPIYQCEPESGLSFSFHHDAILDGKLVGLEGSDSSKITHPSFFKNLTKTCLPLENFFSIDNLINKSNDEKQNFLTSELLGITMKKEDRYSHLLQIDYSDQNQVSLEISEISTYHHKLEKNGTAYFEYFGINPKRKDINLNMFREFFAQAIGKQIIQMSLGGSRKASKSKLNALLIPSFFMEPTFFSREEEGQFDYLKTNKDVILRSHPQILNNNYELLEEPIARSIKTHPWHTLGLMTYFKGQLEEALSQIHSYSTKHNQKINFNNPLIIEGITKLSLEPLYPSNPHVFIETCIKDPNEMCLSLTSTKFIQSQGNHSLQLINDNLVVVELFAEEETLLFTNFILGSAIGSPISTTLQNLYLPNPKDLGEVLKNFSILSDELINQIKVLDQKIFRTFTYHINT